MRRFLAFTFLLVACSEQQGIDSAWEQRARMEVSRSEMPAAVLDDVVWVSGGLTANLLGFAGSVAVEVYDPASDSWKPGPDLPEKRHHAMSVALGDDLYLLGGMVGDTFNPIETAWRLRDGKWESLAPLPSPRAAGAAVAVDGAIYLLGGVPDGASVVRFDPASGAWSEVASLTFAREHTAAAVYDGRVLVAGGRWNGEMLTSVEVYDAALDRWAAGPGLLEARSGFALVSTGAALVALGGEVFDPPRSLGSVEVFNGEAWERGPTLPEGLHGVPAVVIDGAVYVIGGSRRAGDVDNAGDVWRMAISDLKSTP